MGARQIERGGHYLVRVVGIASLIAFVWVLVAAGLQVIDRMPVGLPACATEDSHDCFWDADTMGNGQGSSFYDVGGVITYVNE